MKWVLIAIGGALGSMLRYRLQTWLQGLVSTEFPVGTLTVNILGCLAVGFLAAAFNGPLLIREELRIAAVVGVLGGFTTFSAFSLESMRLINDGHLALAALNVVGSCLLGLLGVWGGTWVGQHYLGGA